MPFTATRFPGLMIFEPAVIRDSRGYFFESYSERTCKEAGIQTRFIQDNQAGSIYGVLRGLHYQLAPYAQTKFIRVLSGKILDVVLDLRKGSPTFGEHFSIELTAENQEQLYIPKGFAHGYSVLSEKANVFYKCDAFYHKAAEVGIQLFDPALNIDWQVPEPDRILSEKDKQYPLFSDAEHNFIFEQNV